MKMTVSSPVATDKKTPFEMLTERFAQAPAKESSEMTRAKGKAIQKQSKVARNFSQEANDALRSAGWNQIQNTAVAWITSKGALVHLRRTQGLCHHLPKVHGTKRPDRQPEP